MRKYGGVLLGTAIVLLAGCRSTPAQKPLSEMTPVERQGHDLFQAYCSGCHYSDRASALAGPGLAGVFKKQYLPSGAPANDDRVRSTIVHGRGMMPPFGDSFDEQQMQALLAYLHTL